MQLVTLLLSCTLQRAAVMTNVEKKALTCFLCFCYSGAAVLVQVP